MRKYTVYAITHDSRKVSVVGNLREKDEALYIEERIENLLGIEDKVVKGEVGS